MAGSRADNSTAGLPETMRGSDGRSSSRASVRRGMILVGLQFGGLVVLSVIVAVLDLDRAIAGLFYRPEENWFLGRTAMVVWVYHYGTIPGALLTLGCLAGWMISFFNQRLAPWRPYFLLVVLTTVIAAGILVNGVLKSYWGRPRPNQTIEFGGFYAYRHVFPPGTPGKGASFPCGHCAMGFAVASLYFVRRRSRTVAWSGAAAGLVLGSLLSAARIINGAHFFTDSVWSLGIIAMTATALHYCILRIPANGRNRPAPRLTTGRRVGLVTLALIAAVIIGAGFLSRRPFYKTMEYYPPITEDTRRLVVRINARPERLVVAYRDTDRAAVLIHAHGFGWANADYSVDHAYHRGDGQVQLVISVDARSYFAELDHTVEVVLPKRFRDRLTVLVNPDQTKTPGSSGDEG